MWADVVWAQEQPLPPASGEFLWTLAALLGLILLGLGLIVWVNRWRRQAPATPAVEEQLASYRALLAEGLLTPEELARIEGVLKRPASPPAAPPAAPAQSPPSAASP